MFELFTFWLAVGLSLVSLLFVSLSPLGSPADEEGRMGMAIVASILLVFACVLFFISGQHYGKLHGCGLPMSEKVDGRLWENTAYESIGEVVAGITHYSLVRQIDFIGGEYPLVCIKTTASVPKHFHLQDGKLVPISDK